MMICGSDEAVSMLIRMCKRSRSNRALLVKKKLNNDQMQLPEEKKSYLQIPAKRSRF